MTTQQQDLVFFDDNSLLSDKIITPENRELHIITHAEGTQPAWLINSLIETCLIGTANSVNRDLVRTASPRASVTYVSFLHPKEFVFKSCRKQGLDLECTNDFFFVDCFSELFSKQIVTPEDSKAQIDALFSGIIKQIHSNSRGSHVVVVDSPELLLSATNLSSNDLIHHLQRVNQDCNSMIVVSNIDDALIDMGSVTPADPVYRITDFFVKLHHKSSLNVNLSPLSTGKAKDITGCLTVSKGALPPRASVRVLQKEYVFHVSKESNVKIFFR
ncbi:hypothetical protein JCM33374_g3668 [Metschnikowia sp. JCM 33374]|nr:hypothetical protein JCM33374_g3668 [Metschnikowia sp. JCM 33374]